MSVLSAASDDQNRLWEEHLPPVWAIRVPGLDAALRSFHEGRIGPDDFHNIARIPGVLDREAYNRLLAFNALSDRERRMRVNSLRRLRPYFSDDGMSFTVGNRRSLKSLCGGGFLPVPGRHLDFLNRMVNHPRTLDAERTRKARFGPWKVQLLRAYPFCFQPDRNGVNTSLPFGLTLALGVELARPFFEEELPTVNQLGIACDNIATGLKIFEDPAIYCDAFVTFFKDARHDRDEVYPICGYMAPYRQPICTNCLAFSQGRWCRVEAELARSIGRRGEHDPLRLHAERLLYPPDLDHQGEGEEEEEDDDDDDDDDEEEEEDDDGDEEEEEDDDGDEEEEEDEEREIFNLGRWHGPQTVLPSSHSVEARPVWWLEQDEL